MREKLQQLLVELNKNLVGKEDVMKLSLLTMLAGENLILFGKPGTAKSEIARRLSKVFEEDSYFEYLLTKFTTPEEIFGPLSIQELRKDKFKRNIVGYMPNVKIAFLDEIFKANSSILNSLLTIINEKVYHNGNEKIKVPLQFLISASNELPIGDNELSALYDRFLVRVVVDYLADDDVVELFGVEDEEFKITDSLKMKIKEIEKIKQEAKGVEIPEEIRACIMEIRKEFNNVFKEDKDEVFSDRKFVKIMKFLKVSAYTNGRDKVDLSDIMLLINCLWNRDNNAPKLSSIITKVVQSHVSIKTTDLIASTKSDKKKDSKKTNFDFKGEGTEYNPFLLENIADLIHVDSDLYRDKGYYFEQTCNFDLASIDIWDSIGKDANKPFIGSYNGANHKISNLKGDSGLFANILDSSIENIELENVELNSDMSDTGAIANRIKNSSLSNCCVNGTIVSIGKNVGGLIGKSENCEIISCLSNLNITGKNIVGGLVGTNEKGTIRNSYSSGVIISKDSDKACVGGITGFNIEGVIISSYTLGDIKSEVMKEYSVKKRAEAGGIIGYNKKGVIEKCYSTGKVTATTGKTKDEYSEEYKVFSYSGGIVAINEEGNLSNCYSLGEIYSITEPENPLHRKAITGLKAYSGGIIAYNENGHIKNCLSLGEKIVSESPYTTIFKKSNYGFKSSLYSKEVEDIVQSNSKASGIIGMSLKGITENSITLNAEILGSNVCRISDISGEGIVKNCYANSNLNFGQSDVNSANGKSISLDLMNEKFFNRLGWDFDNIWTWDSTENRPILDLSTPKTNIVSNDKKVIEISNSENDVNIFKENIWL